MRIRYFLFGLVILFGILSSAVYAGVVVTNTDGSMMMIQDGKMKQSGGKQQEGGMIIDPDKNVMIIVNDRDRTYIQTTPDEFCGAVKAKMDEIMEAVPPEQRKMMEQMGVGKRKKGTVKVKVVETGSGGSIAGYSTVKYNVYKNDELFQELWIAEGTPMEKEIRNMRDMMKFLKKMEECTAEMGMGDEHSPLSSSKEYQRLYDKGWVMKSITHYMGLSMMGGEQTAERIEVRSIKVRHIPSSEFQPPKDYRRIPVSDMYRMQE